MVEALTSEILAFIGSDGRLSFHSAAAVFVFFCLASFVPFPRTFLYIGIGALFGLKVIIVLLPSTTIGGILVFLTSRFLFADTVQMMLRRYPYARAIGAAVDSEGWRVVALLRLASPIPNAIQNYAFGVTRIPLLPYAIATFLFTIPQTIFYVSLGYAGAAAIRGEDTVISMGPLLIGVCCLGTAIFLIGRKARRALKEMELTDTVRDARSA